ncbi:MAG: glycosyltransferase [Candidatus Beckwithbacteria bacterium]
MKFYPENLSIVIPCYNEEQRLASAVQICRKFSNRFPNWEFVFVNDGSTDNTAEMIRKTNFKLISYFPNQGKGYALKEGVIQTTKPLVLLSDIDFSTPLTELPKFAAAIKEADLAIGSRKMAGANVIKHQVWFREWLGRQFTNLSSFWLGLKVSDVTCGFKLIKTPAAKELFKKQKIKRWSYDAEILFLAKKMKLKVVEVPVLWENDERTKVSLFKDIQRSLIDLFKIRLNKYEI